MTGSAPSAGVLEVRRPSLRHSAGRESGRVIAGVLVLVSALVQVGVTGAFALAAAGALVLAALAGHAARARIHVTPRAIAKRGLLLGRSVALPPGARLVRLPRPGGSRWGTPSDHAHVAVADRDGAALLRWSGPWSTHPEVIARAAGLPFEDHLEETLPPNLRRLLPLRARYAVVSGLLFTVAMVIAVGTLLEAAGAL